MRVSDFIADMQKSGITTAFCVTGGAAMHLNDSFGTSFSEQIYYLHGEQSCSIAAESYSRITNKPALLSVTAGPGSINALNGVFGAYVDSIPMVIISGQSKTDLLVRTSSTPNLRQLGDQEVDTEYLVKRITKFSATLLSVSDLPQYLAKVIFYASSGRPGPCWLDVPIDIQAASIPTSFYEEYHQHLSSLQSQYTLPEIPVSGIELIVQKLLSAKRPLLYVGSGVRHSPAYSSFLAFINKWSIPVVTSWNSHDLLPSDHPLHVGRPGTVGNRTGNFAVQYSDVLIVVGCRLNIRQIGYNYQSFADASWKCHVDIDPSELSKKTLSFDIDIHSDASLFFSSLDRSLSSHASPNHFMSLQWLSKLKSYLSKFDVYDNPSVDSKFVDLYYFLYKLSLFIPCDSSIVCADGSACVATFQSFLIKSGQSLFHNSGCASMGYELPASIGAYYASKKTTYCIAGDGSIMMNLQDLTTIACSGLPIVIFLINNRGYSSISQTQKRYFKGHSYGCSPDSGLPFPDFSSIAKSFGLKYLEIKHNSSIEEVVNNAVTSNSPLLCEVFTDPDQEFYPKVSSRKLPDGSMVSSRLEDMSPFLDTEVLDSIKADLFSD